MYIELSSQWIRVDESCVKAVKGNKCGCYDILLAFLKALADVKKSECLAPTESIILIYIVHVVKGL